MHSMNAIADQETYHSVDSTSATAETSAEQSEDELHDIMEAFYGAVSEEELKTYQNQRKPASSSSAAALATRSGGAGFLSREMVPAQQRGAEADAKTCAPNSRRGRIHRGRFSRSS